MVKWTQSLLDRLKVTAIAVPYLGESPLCPVAAIRRLLAATPAAPINPLFQL